MTADQGFSEVLDQQHRQHGCCRAGNGTDPVPAGADEEDGDDAHDHRGH